MYRLLVLIMLLISAGCSHYSIKDPMDLQSMRFPLYVRHLMVQGAAIDDNAAQLLNRFEKVSHLYLIDTSISDAGLQVLSRMQDLHHLSLNGTPLSDLGVQRLGELTSLHSLDIPNTAVTDDALVHLRGLTKLETLYLDATTTSDEGIQRALRGMQPIEYLHGSWKSINLPDMPSPSELNVLSAN